MAFSFDADRTVRQQRCPGCGREFEHVVAFVMNDGNAFAIYHAQCHDHGGAAAPAAWLDITIGSWDEPAFDDQATVSVRVSEDGAGFVDAPVVTEASGPQHGRKLSRVEAMADSRAEDLWRLVDFVVAEDPTVNSYVYMR